MAESEPQPDNDSSDGCFLRHEDKKSKELYSVSSSSEGKVEDPLKFPPKPEEPLQSDCCGTGCTPCVFDIYDQELRLWEKECKKIRLGVGTELAGRVNNLVHLSIKVTNSQQVPVIEAEITQI